MSQPEYRWRRLTPKQRAELLAWRKERGHPWHSPPHRPNFGHLRFHITAACFDHQPCIGHRPGRMDDFARDLLAVFAAHASQTFAWCVLPNHYHALVEVPAVCGNWACFTGERRTPGTARRIRAGARCSSSPWSARCGLSRQAADGPKAPKQASPGVIG